LRGGAACRCRGRCVRRPRGRRRAYRSRPRGSRAERSLGTGVRRSLSALPRALSSSARGAVMEPVRWGIVSTAHINRKLLAGGAESHEVDVAAVASRELPRAQEYAEQNGIPRAYGSYEELLGDSNVEAVYIPLPNTMHCEWSIRAVEAGKHVLCEKPMSRHP